ncbi:MAG TPA: hypothetical protein VMW01_15380 [Williamwhitmania sp.]|nr:hypothetical protein [Williamwhitmania sp.]
MKNVPFSLQPEEVLAVSSLLSKRLERDKEDFYRFSDCFNKDFLHQLSGSIEAAKLMEDTEPLRERLRQLQAETHLQMNKLQTLVDEFHQHLEEKEKDMVNYLDISLLSSSIAQNKVDVTITMLRRMLRRIDMLPVVSPSMKKYASEISTNFADISFLLNEKVKFTHQQEGALRDNSELMRTLWRMVESISNAGLLIYRRTNPNKAREYSLAELKNNVGIVSSY